MASDIVWALMIQSTLFPSLSVTTHLYPHGCGISCIVTPCCIFCIVIPPKISVSSQFSATHQGIKMPTVKADYYSYGVHPIGVQVGFKLKYCKFHNTTSNCKNLPHYTHSKHYALNLKARQPSSTSCGLVHVVLCLLHTDLQPSKVALQRQSIYNAPSVMGQIIWACFGVRQSSLPVPSLPSSSRQSLHGVPVS